VTTDALAGVLRSGRDLFNAQFAAARRLYPDLDGDQFRAFLEATVDPLAQAAGERRAEVVMASYELGLELVGKRLAARPFIEDAWRALAAAAPAHVAACPRPLLAAVANALVQLVAAPGARPASWIADLRALAPLCPDVGALLKVGQVRAWRAGLAHYRASALAACDTLAEPLATAAIGGTGPWPALRDRLARDPWFVPGGEGAVIHTLGAFRGFGGVFRVPPRIARRGGQLVVESGGDAWLLTADAFGATFHPASVDERTGAFQTALPRETRLAGGALTIGGQTLAVPLCGELTSVAADETTLALTAAFTHHVTVVALTRLA
jgi:hypothetical protein